MNSIFSAFIPWIIFSILIGHGGQSAIMASAVALLSHLILNMRYICRGFLFDIGALALFTLLLINAVTIKIDLISNNMSLVASLTMAILAWISILTRKPFTNQYAALNMPTEMVYSTTFKRINMHLTIVWAVILTAMVFPGLAYNLGFSITAENRIVVHVILILTGILITTKFPDWFVSHDIKKRFDLNIKNIFNDEQQPRIAKTDFNIDELTSSANEITEVLIVGAGPVGLTTALLLQQHGVATVVLEKHSGLSIHPKARHVSTRSMEIFRRLGVEERIYQHSLPKEQSWFGWFKTLLTGPVSKVVHKDECTHISPCHSVSSSQPYVEKVLLDTYQERGGKILFSHQVDKIAQDDSKVQLTVSSLNSSKTIIYQANYCVAADGTKSSIRQALGIPMLGRSELSANYSIFCEINLNTILKNTTPFGVAFVLADDGPAPMVLSIDGKDKWVFVFPTPGISITQAEEIFTEKYCIEKIKSVIGTKDIEAKIISKQAWSFGSQVANQFAVGKTFFVGDSIHQFIPTGGMGMNAGIGDADNLAWKLAYALQRKSNSKILSSYEAERLPIILDISQWSIQNLQRIANIQHDIRKKKHPDTNWNIFTDEQSKHLDKSNIDLGYRYQSDFIAKETLNQQAMGDNYNKIKIAPGARLPNFSLVYNNRNISSLDLVDTHFVFISFVRNSKTINCIDWGSIPTKIILLGTGKDEYVINNASLVSLGLELDETAMIWVRPDGHIAWTGTVDDLPELTKYTKLQSVNSFTHSTLRTHKTLEYC